MTKPPTIRNKRHALSSPDADKREAVIQELEAIGAAEATDIITWDAMGQIQLTPSSQLSERARRGIKKVKVTPNAHGNQIEVEMHDKLSALRLLAKHRGLLEPNSDDQRPSMIGINVTGPKTTTYEVKDVSGDNEDEAQ
jgi:phospholipase C